MRAPRTVVAIMAKAPRPGYAKTRLSPSLSRAGAARLARGFLLDTVLRVRRVKNARGVLLYAPAAARRVFRRMACGFMLVPQRSGTLGRRLAGAFRDLLELRLGPVIIIGSDTPAVPDAVLDRAVRLLGGGEVDGVLGPAEDGGYYLIGLRRPCPALFEDIAWSTQHVFRQTVERARQHRHRLAILPQWWDVDTPADVERLRAWLASHREAGLPHTRRALRTLSLGDHRLPRTR